ncbi:MAG: hypothetical protein ACR2FO_04580 [Actinomycetota bacterium]
MAITMTPAEQGRGWEHHWQQIQRELEIIKAPHLEQLGGETIHDARRRLLGFYVLCYHLKDEIKRNRAVPDERSVEMAITRDPNLALLADLANLVKHGECRIRSGAIPKIGRVSASSSGDGGWALNLVIHHGPQDIDGLIVAGLAVQSWEQWLTKQGLLPS